MSDRCNLAGTCIFYADISLVICVFESFLDLPGKIPGLGWLLIFNTLIAGLITSFINARLLEPITRLGKAMKAVSQGDFEQHLETNSRIAEIGESYQSFNVMTKELRATEMLQMDFVSNVSHEFKTPINAIEGYTMLLQGDELSQEQEGYVEKSCLILKGFQALLEIFYCYQGWKIRIFQ